MSMATGSKKHQEREDPIFEDVTLYKAVKTNKGRTVLIHNDGSVSMVIPFEGINNTAFSESDYESMFKGIQNVFDGLDPESVSVQFIMMRDSNVGSSSKDKLPTYLRPRAEYLENLADNYMLFVNRFYLSIHCRADTVVEDSFFKQMMNRFKYRNDNFYNLNRVFAGIEGRTSKVVETADALCQMLAEIGASFRVIQTEQEYYDILQEFVRPNKSKLGKIKIDNSDRVSSPRQQIFSGVRASTRKFDFDLDDYFHKVWTLDRSPRETIFGRTIEAIETVPFEFIYSITFRTATQQESLSTFKGKLFEKRVASGSNANALVEDRTLIAEEKRISDSYDQFAFGDGVGVVASANFVLRAKEEYLEKLCKRQKATREEMIRRFDQTLNKRVFASFGASEWVCEQGLAWPVFCQVIPGMSNMSSGVLKSFFLTSVNVPYFLAIYDNKRNLPHNGTNHFVDLRGNRVNFDLMDPTLPAWNYSISGQTGSGKSVLMNAILTMQFADMASKKSPIICILDVGGDRGSYMKFMELVGGTQINLSRTVKPAIQMFELVAERSIPTTDKIKQVAEMLHQDLKEHPQENVEMSFAELETKVRDYYNEKLTMSVDELNNPNELRKRFAMVFGFEEKPEYKHVMTLKPGQVIPDQKKFQNIMGVMEVVLSTSAKQLDGFQSYDYDEVSEVILETYRRIGVKENRYPFMTDVLAVASTMVDNKESAARKMLTKIKNYTREGAYPMFDQKTNINLDNDVILADLKGLESEPQLQIIYTLLISQLFNDKMYFSRDRRKLIVRDEAWSLMQNEKARRYFVEDLRTARKNGFATISITQLPTDYLFPNEQDGRAIISNFQVNVFCRFSSDAICRQVGKEYGLNEEMVEEMKTLGVQKEMMEDGSFRSTYSKFMMVVGKNVYLLKNMLHPFEYALYSSSAEDNAIIEYYLKVKKAFKNIEETLWFVAENHHIGDLELAVFLEESGQNNMAKRVRDGKKA